MTKPPLLLRTSMTTPSLRAVLGVEIEVQLVQRAFRHVVHVHVAEPAAADLVDVGAVPLDPLRDRAGSSPRRR